jgi:hypothetical protein
MGERLSPYGEGGLSNGVIPVGYEPVIPPMYASPDPQTPSEIKVGKSEVERLLGYPLDDNYAAL